MITRTDGGPVLTRGLATRLRILQSLDRHLTGRRYHDVEIARVAQDANTSPASFYSYFPDLQTAVLALAALDQPLQPHLQRVVRLIELEDTAFGVRREPQPDTRLELLSALISARTQDGELTAQDACDALKSHGFEITAERCDALLSKLADRGELWPISPNGFVRTKPTPAAV
jgi:AcrR family transcriptional regulator